MSMTETDRAIDRASFFRNKAFEISNAIRMGRFQGYDIKGRRLIGDHVLAEGILLLDSVAFHIACTYARRKTDELKNSGQKDFRGAKKIQTQIITGFTRLSNELYEFFYPDHPYKFNSTTNPWLTKDGMRTSVSIAHILPLCIQKLASVAYRDKNSWEHRILKDVIPVLVEYAEELVTLLPGRLARAEGTFDRQAIEDFGTNYIGFVGKDTRLAETPHQIAKVIPSPVIQYLGRSMDSLEFITSRLSEGETKLVRKGELVRLGQRAFICKADLELSSNFEPVPGQFDIL